MFGGEKLTFRPGCDLFEEVGNRCEFAFVEVLVVEQIIEYIKNKYSPLTIIVYGSYASGTNNLNSDFDVLVISQHHSQFHDTSFVDGVQLDVFVYTTRDRICRKIRRKVFLLKNKLKEQRDSLNSLMMFSESSWTPMLSRCMRIWFRVQGLKVSAGQAYLQ